MGTERELHIKLQYKDAYNKKNGALASVGFRVVFRLFQSLVQPISRDRRGNLILPKVPILDADALTILKAEKNRVIITLRYDPRQTIQNQEDYLGRMKSFYLPRLAQKGTKAITNDKKDEHIRTLGQLNNTLHGQVSNLQKQLSEYE